MTPFRRLLLLSLLLAGCTPAVRVPLPPPAPPPVSGPTPPAFERTFGDASAGKTASLVLKFKTITIVIDPDIDAAAMASLSPQIDYVLLTDAAPRHFSAGALSSLRRDTKIIASPEEAAKVKTAGFSEVKALSAGQRILLKKKDGAADAFLFVTAAQSRNKTTKLQVNSYLLEFDGGHNLLFSGEVPGADSLRDFLYALRDDGKDVYAGFFYAQPDIDAAGLAQMIGLFQPKNAIVSQAGAASIDGNALKDALANELYEGPVVILQEGRQIPF